MTQQEKIIHTQADKECDFCGLSFPHVHEACHKPNQFTKLFVSEVNTQQTMRDRLMDNFCVMFERATMQDDTIDWVEKLETFIDQEISSAITKREEDIQEKLETIITAYTDIADYGVDAMIMDLYKFLVTIKSQGKI